MIRCVITKPLEIGQVKDVGEFAGLSLHHGLKQRKLLIADKVQIGHMKSWQSTDWESGHEMKREMKSQIEVGGVRHRAFSRHEKLSAEWNLQIPGAFKSHPCYLWDNWSDNRSCQGIRFLVKRQQERKYSRRQSRNDGRLTIITACTCKNESRSKERVIRNDTKQGSRCIELKE